MVFTIYSKSTDGLPRRKHQERFHRTRVDAKAAEGCLGKGINLRSKMMKTIDRIWSGRHDALGIAVSRAMPNCWLSHQLVVGITY